MYICTYLYEKLISFDKQMFRNCPSHITCNAHAIFYIEFSSVFLIRSDVSICFKVLMLKASAN